VGAAGFLPLPWSEIDAFARLQHITFRPWELDVITTIDDEWRGWFFITPDRCRRRTA